MKYELFGVAPTGNVEFLGTFNDHEKILDAVDEYTGIGYKNVKVCAWVL